MGGRLLTRPFLFLSLLVLIAVVLLLFRFVYGLGAATNLNNGYPWGLWVVLDIHITAAIGCGGYVLAVVIYVMNKGEFHTLIRPALVASTFAYTLANLAAWIDIGRWWNFYQIALPWNINLNSVMFEVAICMALYTLILWIELVPPALEHYGKQKREIAFFKSLYVIIPLGIVLPTMHQSGLGSLIIAAGTKISPLWQSPWIGFLFLTSAIIIGFSIVLFEGMLTIMGLGRRLELHLYQRLMAVLRFNALIIGYTPSAGYVYFPSVIELLVSIGLAAVEIVGFICIVKRFPVLPPRTHTVVPGARKAPAGMAAGQGAA
jgi:Ni/Fe-hydrogenase subunit HybB-like protein